MRPKRTTILASELTESFRMATTALAAHKLRSSLTLLGILVGVFSIIVVMTAMRVMQSDIESRISRLGSQSFVIRKFPGIYFGGPEGFEKYWRRKNITLAQGLQLQERATLASAVGVETTFWGGQVETRYKKTAPTVQLYGETAGSFPARNWILADGRLVLDADVDGCRDVCVLGSSLATNVFPFGSAVGERLKINTTGLNRFGRWNRSLNLLVQAGDQASYDNTVEEARGIMRVLRKVPPGKEDDFEILSNDSLIAQFKTFTRAVRLGIAFVSSIALLAAGIGIMNIMLVSVTERTREIGIRRAVGAKKRNIMTQFIMEAIVLCEIGGAVGVVLGILGGNATAFFLKKAAVIPVDWIIIGLVICSVVGIIFGTYPAWKAANLDPIDSLRYE